LFVLEIIGKEGNTSDNKYNHAGEEALGSTCMDSNASGGAMIVSGGVALTPHIAWVEEAHISREGAFGTPL
jgi:hypothetical protein